MLIKEKEELDPVKTEIFNLLVGFDDEKTLEEKKSQCQRLLRARRAIEEHRELRELSPYINDDSWFDD